MLRLALSTSPRRAFPRLATRGFTSKSGSPVKRALTNEQIKGSTVTGASTTPPTLAPEVRPPEPPKTISPSPNGGVGGSDPTGGGGEYMLPIAVIATTLGAAWYFDFIPGMGSGATKKEKPGEAVKVGRTAIPAVKDPAPKNPDAVVERVVTPEKPVVKKSESKEPAAVAKEVAPPVPDPVIEQVKVEELKAVPKSKPKTKPKPEPVVQVAPEPAQPKPEPIPEPVIAAVVSSEPVCASVEDATRELQSAQTDESSATLQKAHRALRASIDESLYR